MGKELGRQFVEIARLGNRGIGRGCLEAGGFELDTGTLSQLGQGFAEFDLLRELVEGEEVAALSASETVKVLRFRKDDERWRLFYSPGGSNCFSKPKYRAGQWWHHSRNSG